MKTACKRLDEYDGLEIEKLVAFGEKHILIFLKVYVI